MTTSNGDQTTRILADPAFHAAVRKRARFGWGMAILMCVIYFGFILLVAFAPGTLAEPIGDGTLTLGLVVGLIVILSALILTAIYVAKANSAFDHETRSIVERSR